MKKFVKLTTAVVSMVMALTFVSCANGNTSNNDNENSNDEQLNLVGTYGISKIEYLYNDSCIIHTMPTSTSFRQYGTLKHNNGSVEEVDFTVTKTSKGYSFNWVKYDVDGVDQLVTDAKAKFEAEFNDEDWNSMTAEVAMTLTTTAEGTWSDNGTPASSGTYTVDEANSKVTIKLLIREGETLKEPEIMEATYSNNGKTLVVVQDHSFAEGTGKSILTLTRK